MKKFMNLHSMPRAQAYVILSVNDDGTVEYAQLLSYNTVICTAIPFASGVSITLNYPADCSTTTARHVNRFTTECTGASRYHDLKKLKVNQCVYYSDCEDTWLSFIRDYIRRL